MLQRELVEVASLRAGDCDMRRRIGTTGLTEKTPKLAECNTGFHGFKILCNHIDVDAPALKPIQNSVYFPSRHVVARIEDFPVTGLGESFYDSAGCVVGAAYAH